MTEDSNADEITNRCACGWEVTGPVDEVVDATIDHGARIHNMVATREQVLAALGRSPDASAEAREAS
jgi:hypothetical protein